MVDYDKVKELINRSRHKCGIPISTTPGEIKHSDVYIKRAYSKISIGSSEEYIDSEIIPAGKIGIVYRIAGVDRTSDYDKITTGIWNGTILHRYGEHSNTLADILYWIDKPFKVGEGDNLRIIFKGTTANDILEMYINLELKDVY